MRGTRQPQVGLDLGTARTRLVIPGRGLCADLPTVIALRGEQVVAVGDAAVQLEDRCPPDISVLHPMMDNRVYDHRAVELFVGGLLRQALGRTPRKPNLTVSVAPTMTEVERSVLVGRLQAAGGGEVRCVPSPYLLALGVGLDLHSPTGHLLADLGAGQSSFSCLALGRIVHHTSTLAAGDQLTADIQRHVAEIRGLNITRNTAQTLKHHLVDVSDRTAKTRRILGRDVRSHQPREDDVAATELASGTRGTIGEMRQTVRDLLSRLSPQLCADVLERGLILGGGGAELNGLVEVLRADIELPVLLSPMPANAIAVGLEATLQDPEPLDRALGHP